MIDSLRNHLLIAMPSMADPNFNRTVTYICEHSEEGAIGVIINRPLDVSLNYVLQQMNIKTEDEEIANYPVLFGGPVQQERGFVIHKPCGHWQSSLPITKDISVTTSEDVLRSVADGNGPKEILVVLGYAGWQANQLEQEIANNVWLSCPATDEILFSTPFTKRWEAAAGLIGININHLSGDVGHA